MDLAILVSIPLWVTVFAYPKLKKKIFIAPRDVVSMALLVFLICFAWIGAGSLLGSYYGGQVAVERATSPKPGFFVTLHIKPEQEASFSKEFQGLLKYSQLIRIFQNKDLLVVLPKGTQTAYTIQMKDVAEIRTAVE